MGIDDPDGRASRSFALGSYVEAFGCFIALLLLAAIVAAIVVGEAAWDWLWSLF